MLQIVYFAQHGFRKDRRTTDSMFILNTPTNKIILSKDKLFACSVDFSKAIDFLWLNGMLFKIFKIKLSEKCFKVFTHIHSVCGKMNKRISQAISSTSGVYSLASFNLYLNDIDTQDVHQI